ncbi:WD40 repeat domain-containing protein [Virgisporangium aurantiacum]|uniref:WD40 repeat domain-containing protein n=1 Tax=Virgisporangium aurantiacum TaxID=175570 RepID=A0A8J3Z8B5_9ACTN|nr:WD40 repeat domain-containing protein [Virgisporangium aurantiacum]GIJ58218.1 hypothetical protein Vau01_057340 [Virgisporangium aurantiacum]
MPFKPLTVIEGPGEWVGTLAFSPDGATLASGSGDRTVRFWDARTGEPKQTFWRAPEKALYIGKVAYDPSGTRLAVSTGTRTVRIWDLSGTARRPQTLTGRVRYSFDVVRDIAFSPDGGHLAVGYSDGRLRIWNTRTGGQVAGFRDRRRMRREIAGLAPRTGGVYAVTYLPDGERIAVADRVPSVSLYDAATGCRLTRLGDPAFELERDMNAVAAHPDGTLLASADFDLDRRVGDIMLWDLPSGTARRLRRRHTGVINRLVINPAGTLLASVANVDPVHLWHLPSGEHAATLTGHRGSVRSAAFHPDGSILATGADDTTIRLWSM